MARLQWQTLQYSDFSKGMNTANTPDALQDGECEKILNGDLTPGGDIRKRVGYGQSTGTLPFRAQKVQGIGGKLCIFLALDGTASIDFTSFVGKAIPIIVYGKVSPAIGTNLGDLATTNGYDYYTSASCIMRQDGSSNPYLEITSVAAVGAATDTTPQVCVLGVPVETRVTTAAANKVTFLETYTREATSTLVAGLNGNIFTLASGSPYTAASLQLNGTHTAAQALQLKTPAGAASTANLVVGDVLSITGYTQLFKIKYIHSVADANITDLSRVGSVVTATVASTSALFVGQHIVISGSTSYNGEQTIVSIPGATTFTFTKSTGGSAETGTLKGYTVTVDSAVTGASGAAVTSQSRWKCIEMPDRGISLTTTTTIPAMRIKHFELAPTSAVQVAASNDNLYLTNGVDPVLKYDGVYVYTAGLIPWTPKVFAWTDTTNSSISAVDFSVPYTYVAGNTYFTCALDSTKNIKAGQYIYDDDDKAIYEVQAITTDGVSDFVHVVETITGGAGTTIGVASVYSYYFRLRTVDYNGNVTISATTQRQDVRVVTPGSCQIQLKLVGLPALSNYDFDHIEMDVFRTMSNSSGPFYKIQTLIQSFVNNDGYISFADRINDAILTEADLDAETSALKGGNLGTALEPPPLADFITVASNKTILAGVSRSQYATLQFFPPNAETHFRQSLYDRPFNITLIKNKASGDTSINNKLVVALTKNIPRVRQVVQVAMSGDGSFYAIAGSPVSGSGVYNYVYVYYLINENEQKLQKILIPCQYSIDSLAFAYSGDRLFIGCGGDLGGIGGAAVAAGAVYVYRRSGEEWTLEARLTDSVAGAAGDHFGTAVHTGDVGGIVAIGAPNTTVGAFANAGSAYIYTRTGTAWARTSKLDGAAATEYFGNMVAVNSDESHLAVSAPCTTGVQGYVKMYQAAGPWALDDTELDPAGVGVYGNFGQSMAYNKDASRLIVGAPMTTIGAVTEQGQAHVYTRAGAAYTWQYALTIQSMAAQNSDRYGSVVAHARTGTSMIVGKPGIISMPRIERWNAAVYQDSYSLSSSIGYDYTSAAFNSAMTRMISTSPRSWGASSGTYYLNTIPSYDFILGGGLVPGNTVLLDSVAGIPHFSAITDTSFTISNLSSPPSAGSWIYLYDQDSSDFPGGTSIPGDGSFLFSGWWQVASAGASSITITFPKAKGLTSATLENTTTFVDATTDTIKLGGDAALFPINSRVMFFGTTNLPTGITTNTLYYVISNDGVTISLSLEKSGAVVPIAATGTGTFTMHLINFPRLLMIPTTTGHVPIPIAQDWNDRTIGAEIDDPYSIKDSDAFLKRITSSIANAVNAVMRQANITLSGQTSFVPWLSARSSDFAPGYLEFFSAAYSATSTCSVNSFARASVVSYGYGEFKNSGSNGTVTADFVPYDYRPSRLLRSFENYPEVFDNCFADSASESYSAIDVNPADGQYITGLVNYFAESATAGSGGSARENMVIVFKNASIYAVNVDTKEVQKLDTKGQGCTASDSIASSANGIFFANASGIWLLNKQLQLEYVGKHMSDWYDSQVNKSSISLAAGHNDAVGRKYKLSVPATSASSNSLVGVLNYSRQDEGVVGWSYYDNHPATCWTQKDGVEYFGTTDGRVMTQRQAGDTSDYVDDETVVSMEVVHKAFDFGLPGQRKAMSHIVSRFLGDKDMTATTLSVACDLSSSFTATETISLDAADGKKVAQFKTSVPKTCRKGTYFQTKYVNAAKEQAILTGFDLVVAGLTPAKGLKDVAEED